MHRWEILRYTGSTVDVELSTDFHLDQKRRTVTLQLGVHYSALRTQMIRRLLDYVIDVEFEVSSLDGVVHSEDNEVLITEDMLRLILGLGIGAIRGMVALRTADTFLIQYPLPIYDMNTLIANIVGIGTDVNYSSPETFAASEVN